MEQILSAKSGTCEQKPNAQEKLYIYSSTEDTTATVVLTAVMVRIDQHTVLQVTAQEDTVTRITTDTEDRGNSQDYYLSELYSHAYL